MRFSVISLACLASLCVPMLAEAQERLPFRGGPDDRSMSGARFIKPGALLLASFDRNHDLLITSEEIEAGASLAFQAADTDGSAYLTPIEQRNWATRITSEDDVLGNPSLFISSTPGQVLEAEFISGLQIFAQRFEDENGEIRFTELTFEPQARDRNDREDDGGDLERLRRPSVERTQNSPVR